MADNGRIVQTVAAVGGEVNPSHPQHESPPDTYRGKLSLERDFYKGVISVILYHRSVCWLYLGVRARVQGGVSAHGEVTELEDGELPVSQCQHNVGQAQVPDNLPSPVTEVNLRTGCRNTGELVRGTTLGEKIQRMGLIVEQFWTAGFCKVRQTLCLGGERGRSFIYFISVYMNKGLHQYACVMLSSFLSVSHTHPDHELLEDEPRQRLDQ